MFLLLCAGLVSACAAPAPLAVPLNDPYEASNRRAHDFNRSVDQAVLRPLSRVYGGAATGPVGQGVANVAGNLSTPGMVANKLLQGRIVDGFHNTVRFALNSTIGLVGLFDVAAAMGLEERDTDFGETLHVWGAGEGAYMVLPFVGPTTERDTLGMVVDALGDPLGVILPKKAANVARVAKIGSKLSDRAQFSDTVDSILYDSADSYAQSRLLYLQHRRFELGQESADDGFDPYDDPYGQ